MNIFQKNEQRDVGWQYISLTAGNDEDGIFYCEADNAIGSACLFPPLAGWDDKTPDAAAVLLNEPYPGGTIMQFIHFGSPYIRPVTETYALARFGVSGDAAVQTAQYGVRERAAFIERGSRHRLVPTTETRILEGYCLWTFKIPLKTQNPFSGSPNESEAFRKECDEFLKLRTRALSQLTVMGITNTPTPIKGNIMFSRLCFIRFVCDAAASLFRLPESFRQSKKPSGLPHSRNRLATCLRRSRERIGQTTVLLALLLAQLPAWADALPASIDAGADQDITTLWVVGDIDVLAKGLNAVAMFFNGGGTGSPLISLLQLGAMLALTSMLVQFITKRTMQPVNTFLMIIIVSALFYGRYVR